MLFHGRSKKGVPKVEGVLEPYFNSIHNYSRIIADHSLSIKRDNIPDKPRHNFILYRVFYFFIIILGIKKVATKTL